MAAYPVLLDELEGKQRYHLRAVEGKLSPDVVVPDGLVLYLPMLSGRGGTVLDHSTYGNHGTIYGAKWTKEDDAWALEFDGVDDYGDCGSDSSLSGMADVTMMAWIKTNVVADQQIVRNQGALDFTLLSTGGILYLRPALPIGGVRYDYGNVIPVPTREWAFVAFTKRSVNDYITAYVNGIPRTATRTGSKGLIDSTTQPLLIGTDRTIACWFDGLIGEVRIYNRALSDAEIRLLYENTGPRRVFR